MGAIHRPAGASDEFHAGARAALASRRPEQVVITPAPDLTLEATFVPVFDDAGRGTHILWTARDVTRETQGRARIAAQLAEKETLLREVHHRVKNNLQIVTSLLSLQQHAVDSPDVAMMLEESRRRVAAMALVHEHLYAADVLAEVDMASYVRRLSTSLVASFGTLPSRVELRLAGTSFPLPMERAIPCGLLLNELLTNALKHAFPGDRRGSITVRLDREDAADTIDVRDDGVGFAPDLESTPRSLGLQLLPRLAAQLGGSLERGQDAPGTQYRLRLPRRA
jgi:two-component sensor histidine kinase